MNNETICIIPFRKGSKRMKNKNISLFCNKPLAYWTIKQAISLKCFDKILISTDYSKKKISKNFDNKKIKYLKRTTNISKDNSTILDVIKHTIKSEKIRKNNTVVVLPVTNPLRKNQDIIKGIKLFKKRKHCIISISKNDNPPHLLWIKQKNKVNFFYNRKNRSTRKQDFVETYIWNDAFIIDYSSNFLEKKIIYGNDPFFYCMPKERSICIDDKIDFKISEYFFKKNVKKKN